MLLNLYLLSSLPLTSGERGKVDKEFRILLNFELLTSNFELLIFFILLLFPSRPFSTFQDDPPWEERRCQFP
jgi:hypothetical protein